MLLLSVHESVHVVGSGNISTEDDVSVTSHQEETRVESLFLKALQRHLKELCQELLNSSGLRYSCINIYLVLPPVKIFL